MQPSAATTGHTNGACVRGRGHQAAAWFSPERAQKTACINVSVPERRALVSGQQKDGKEARKSGAAASAGGGDAQAAAMGLAAGQTQLPARTDGVAKQQMGARAKGGGGSDGGCSAAAASSASAAAAASAASTTLNAPLPEEQELRRLLEEQRLAARLCSLATAEALGEAGREGLKGPVPRPGLPGAAEVAEYGERAPTLCVLCAVLSSEEANASLPPPSLTLLVPPASLHVASSSPSRALISPALPGLSLTLRERGREGSLSSPLLLVETLESRLLSASGAGRIQVCVQQQW